MRIHRLADEPDAGRPPRCIPAVDLRPAAGYLDNAGL